MFISNTERTLDDQDINYLVACMREEYSCGVWNELSFQSRTNRDLVYKAAKAAGMELRKTSTPGQIIDPRYTVEGSHLPDKGLANDQIMTNLYHISYGQI